MAYSIFLSDAVGPIYRKGIFQKLDQNHNVTFLFGLSNSTVKSIADSDLKNISRKPKIKVFGKWYWQQGIFSNVFGSKKDVYILGGELFSLSNWIVLSLNYLFFKPKNIVLWSHGWYGRESNAKKFIKKIYFGMACKSLFYGEYAKRQMQIAGSNVENVDVIHNSLDYYAQKPLRKVAMHSNIIRNHFNNDYPTIIFIGRLTKSKKLHLLLHAANILNQKGIQVNILIIGNGEDEECLKDISRQYNLNTWFYGPSYDEEINAQLLAQSDLCVSPGNVGLTAIHSMMFGTPVITHSNFANQGPEFEAIISDKTGAFFEEEDVQSLADTISNWLNSKSDRAAIRQACYAEIDNNWNPDFQIRIIEKNISHILKKK